MGVGLLVALMPAEFLHLAATILSGNSEGLIADAILCVRDWVELISWIDTGIADGTLGGTAAGFWFGASNPIHLAWMVKEMERRRH